MRELKAAKANKSLIDAEIATLLQLKKELALAQGHSTDGCVKKGKKK